MSKSHSQLIFETSDPSDPIFMKIRETFQESNIAYVVEGNEPRIDANGTSYFDVKIMVQNDIAHRAVEIIRKIKSDMKSPQTPAFCPNCDDNRIVEREGFSLIPWITNKKFKCMNCGFEWKNGKC